MPHNKEKEILLLDYYGSLLTKHQSNVLEEYLNEDLSMNEIADNLNISKSAVADLINRSIKQLEEYDKHLNLIRYDHQIHQVIEEMYNENDKLLNKYADKLNRIKQGE